MEHPSPLAGFEDLPPLSQEKAANGSYLNPPRKRPSEAYDRFPAPIANVRAGFDVHIYYDSADRGQSKYARELWERIRREFPDLPTYSFFEMAIGPHPLPMFEVNVLSPRQFGALVSWLVIYRGSLSVLVHPNTGDALGDHTDRATWMGKPLELRLDILKKFLGQ